MDWRLSLSGPLVIRLSCISLFSMGPKLDNFWRKKIAFGSSSVPLNKILVLLAFTTANRFFKRLYEPGSKRAKKRCRPYTSFFSDMNAKLLKLRIICSCEISVFFVQKFSLFWCLPPFLVSAPPYFGCSGDGTGGG